MRRILISLFIVAACALAFAGPGIGITTDTTLKGTGATTNALGVATAPNNTLEGNISGVTAQPSPLTATQATSLLNVFTSSLKGLVPASGGGTLTYMRADGTWATPPGTGTTGTGTTGDLTAWASSSTVGNYSGSSPAACSASNALTRATLDATGALSLTCASMSSLGAATGTGTTSDLAIWSSSSSVGNYAGSSPAACAVGQVVTRVTEDATGALTLTCAAAGSMLAPMTNDEATSIAIGTVVYVDANNGVKKAIATGLTTANAIGLVNDTSISSTASGNIITVGLLTATTGQWDAVAGTTGGLAFGTRYYVDPTTAGHLTATAPSTTGQYVEEIGIAISTTTLIVRPRTPIGL